jgi:hypothetical protein
VALTLGRLQQCSVDKIDENKAWTLSQNNQLIVPLQLITAKVGVTCLFSYLFNLHLQVSPIRSIYSEAFQNYNLQLFTDIK